MPTRARIVCSPVVHNLRYLARPRWLAALFILCALPTGLGYAVLTPLGAPPDELAHIVRAEGLRLGQIAEPPSPIGSPGVWIDAGVYYVVVYMQLAPYDVRGNMPAGVVKETSNVNWIGRKLFCPTQMTAYFPIFYLPAALGLWAGKATGLAPLHAIYLARLVMLFCYIAMGATALCLARFGRPLLFAALTLPTSICLGASCSQDGQLIAACVLAAALLTRAGPALSLAWCGAVFLLSAVALSKLNYVFLLLLCLPPLRAAGLVRRAGGVLLGAIPAGLWFFHLRHMGFAHWPYAPYHPGPLWPGDRSVWLHDAQPANNIRVLLAHPQEILLLPLHALATDWAVIWRKALACVSVDVVLLHAWEYPCLAAAAVFAALASPPAGAPQMRAADAGFSLFILFCSFLGVELSLYLTYTAAGATNIIGVQGRYFLPVLPFCILPLAWLLDRRSAARMPEWLFCLPAVALALVNTYALPDFVFKLFQMPPA